MEWVIRESWQRKLSDALVLMHNIICSQFRETKLATLKCTQVLFG